MGPATQAPSPPAPTPALPLLLGQKVLDASRTEILVLASGILFLASQVCLLVWFLSRRTAPGKKKSRKVSILLSPEAAAVSPRDDADTHEDNAGAPGNGNGDDEFPLRLRRRSTWGGHSAHTGSRTQGRRKSAGTRGNVCDGDYDGSEEDAGENQGAQTSLGSPGPESEPEASHVTLAAFGDMGRVAAAFATPAPLPLPLPSGIAGEDGVGSGGGADDTELREFDPRRAWCEAGLLGASIEKPRSPRSPRVLAADQAAMMDALCAENGGEKDSKVPLPSPEDVLLVDPPALGLGFDDPLGVNRLVLSPRGDEDGHESIELELRDGGRQDV